MGFAAIQKNGIFAGAMIGKPGLLAVALIPAMITAAWGEDGISSIGARIYAAHCARCHGESGRGDGPHDPVVPRPDFASGQFKLVSTDNGVPTPDDLRHSIFLRLPEAHPETVRRIAESDRRAVVDHVLALTQKGVIERIMREFDETVEFAREEAEGVLDPGTSVAIPPRPPLTGEDQRRGERLFHRLCSRCHGDDGRGVEGLSLEDDLGRAVRPTDLVLGSFKGGQARVDIALRLICGMPGTPMPSFGSALEDPAALWSVVDHVLRFRGRSGGRR